MRRSTTVAAQPDRTPLVIAVSSIVILGLITIALLSMQRNGETEPVAETSAPATPSAAASASPSTSAAPSASGERASPGAEKTPAPTASAPADQASALGLPRGLLPAGSVVTATADGIRIREAPSAAAAAIATVAAGDSVFIEARIDAGPVSADGYDWYQVAYAGGPNVWPWQDVVPSAATMYVNGWMAAGSEGERFVSLDEVDCPTDAVTLGVLAFDLTNWARLVCLRDAPFTVEGTFGCDGCGRVTPGATPGWLADEDQSVPLAGSYRYYPYALLAVPPELSPPADRDILRAVLHVDDPASADCAFEPDPDSSPASAVDPAGVEVYCRERLVLETFEVIGRDDFGSVSPSP